MGPKTEADLAPVSKADKKTTKSAKKETKPIENTTSKTSTEPVGTLTILDVMKKLSFHAPGENFKTDGYVVTPNTTKLLQDHIKITSGKVISKI